MPDYREMYLELFRATERAIRILVETQQKCEDLYIASPEPELTLLPIKETDAENEADGV